MDGGSSRKKEKKEKEDVLQGQDSDVVPPGEDRRLAAQGETSDAAGDGSTRCQGGTLMRRGIGSIKTGIATLPTQSMQAVQRGKAIGVALRCLGRDRGDAAYVVATIHGRIGGEWRAGTGGGGGEFGWWKGRKKKGGRRK